MIKNITVIGLGYVGLPLFEQLFTFYKDNVFGIDIDIDKISVLKKRYTTVSNQYDSISFSDVIIIAVPTPINHITKEPNLIFLDSVIKELLKNLQKGKRQIIVLESTVYPGYTDEFIEKLEKFGFYDGTDFLMVYSPERVSPGDPGKDLLSITKLVASNDSVALDIIDDLYSSIGIKTYRIFGDDSFKIAEMSKILENVQRDVNISLMNEFKMLCSSSNIQIDFSKVLDAAETKNGFCKFHPGFVGGHCIAVDPYYLILSNNYYNTNSSTIVETARNINESYIYYYIKKILDFKDIKKISLLGVTYKPNISDVRESGTIKLYHMLKNVYKDISIIMFDPYIENDTQLQDVYDSDIVFFIIPHNWFYENLDFYNFSDKTKFIDITNDIRNHKFLDDFRIKYEFIN